MESGENVENYTMGDGTIESYMNRSLAESPNIHSIYDPPTVNHFRAAYSGGNIYDYGSMIGTNAIKENYARYPNLTYIYMMNKHFGTAKAKVNQLLGTIPK